MGVDGDCMQCASSGRAFAGHTYGMDVSDPAGGGWPALVCKTKEHKSRQRKELFSRGLLSRRADSYGSATGKVPRPCVRRCASAMFLREGGPTGPHPVSRLH